MVAVDVGGDLLSPLVEGFEVGAPEEPLLELAEPRFDERLGFGVALAAAAMRDAEFVKAGTEAAAGQCRSVVGAERERAGWDAAAADGP